METRNRRNRSVFELRISLAEYLLQNEEGTRLESIQDDCRIDANEHWFGFNRFKRFSGNGCC